MRIAYSKHFLNQAKKLPPKIQAKLYQCIRLFAANPLHPDLRNHALKGKYKEYRSIDITGDCRAIYLVLGDQIVFDMVGTHSQLYG